MCLKKFFPLEGPAYSFLPSESFIDLPFIFRPLTYLKFISVYVGLGLSLFPYGYLIDPAMFIEKSAFPTDLQQLLSHIFGAHTCMSLFLGSLSCSLGLLVNTWANTWSELLQLCNKD